MQRLLPNNNKLPTFTVKQLQQKILSKHTQLQTQTQNSQQKYTHHDDLKVLSPFYQRITHEKSNCKCLYHRRQRQAVLRRFKCRTQPDQIDLGLSSPKVQNKEECLLTPQNYLTPRSYDKSLKKIYQQYLKTLPDIDTTRMAHKVDCYNSAFEQFLKQNYPWISNMQNAIKQMTQKAQIQDDSIKQAVGQEGIRQRQLSKREVGGRQDVQKHTQGRYYGNSRNESLKLQRINNRKSNAISQMDEERLQKPAKYTLQYRRRAKFVNNRTSSFGLFEDKQIVKSLCQCFVQEDKGSNEEGHRMIKELVDADMQVFKRAMEDIEMEIREGVNLTNLEGAKVDKLVKIVLHKIRREAKLIPNTNKHYDAKNQMIEAVCSKYGWRKEEKAMKLQQFWKFRRESTPAGNSNSIGLQSKNKLQKKKNLGEKQSKSKLISSENSQMQVEVATGLSGQMRNSKKVQRVNEDTVHCGSSSNLRNSQNELPKAGQKLKETQFKFTNVNKSGRKKGVFIKSGSMGAKSKMFSSSSKMKNVQEDVLAVEDMNRDSNLVLQPVSAVDEGLSFKPRYVQRQRVKQRSGESSQNRYSSAFFGNKNTVQYHIDRNRMFLRKIQKKLRENGCEQLVIDINEGIFTKKRKIRAIHAALERESIRRSDYYQDLIKYLDIYEEYCDIVVQTRREETKTIKVPTRKKGKNVTQMQMTQLLQEGSEERMKEDRQMDQLFEDLKKERELKYVVVKVIEESENPKEELILKIPQYTTNKQESSMEMIKRQIMSLHKRDQSFQERGEWKQGSVEYVRVREVSELSQRSLGEEVRVVYAESTSWDEQQGMTECQVDGYQQTMQEEFERRLQRYRKVLGLSVV